MGCSPGGKERDAHVPSLECESNTSFQLQNWCVLTGNLKLLPKKDAKDKTLHLTMEWAER